MSLCKNMQAPSQTPYIPRLLAIPLLHCTWLHGHYRTVSRDCSTATFRLRCRTVGIYVMCQLIMYRLSSIVDGERDPERIIHHSEEGNCLILSTYCSSCMRGADAEEGHRAGSQLNASYNASPTLIKWHIKIHIHLPHGVVFPTRELATCNVAPPGNWSRLHTGHHAIIQKSGGCFELYGRRASKNRPPLIQSSGLCFAMCPKCLHLKPARVVSPMALYHR